MWGVEQSPFFLNKCFCQSLVPKKKVTKYQEGLTQRGSWSETFFGKLVVEKSSPIWDWHRWAVGRRLARRCRRPPRLPSSSTGFHYFHPAHQFPRLLCWSSVWRAGEVTRSSWYPSGRPNILLVSTKSLRSHQYQDLIIGTCRLLSVSRTALKWNVQIRSQKSRKAQPPWPQRLHTPAFLFSSGETRRRTSLTVTVTGGWAPTREITHNNFYVDTQMTWEI